MAWQHGSGIAQQLTRIRPKCGRGSAVKGQSSIAGTSPQPRRGRVGALKLIPAGPRQGADVHLGPQRLSLLLLE